MKPKPSMPQSGELFRQTLREQINLKHPLVRLADLIDMGGKPLLAGVHRGNVFADRAADLSFKSDALAQALGQGWRGRAVGGDAGCVGALPGHPYAGHTLEEAWEQASILTDTPVHTAVVDRGYRGVDVPGVRILRSGQKRGVTRTLNAMIRRRSAIEPVIGHMKADGKLGRNWLKGQVGDAIHAILCGARHNIRLLLRRLQRFYAWIMAIGVTSWSESHGQNVPTAGR